MGEALWNAKLLLVAMSIFLSVKLYFLSVLIPRGVRTTSARRPWILLLASFIGSLFGDITWIIQLIGKIYLPSFIPISIIAVRITWAFRVFHYQALTLFIESLSEKYFRYTSRHKIQAIISLYWLAQFLYIALYGTTYSTHEAWVQANIFNQNPPLETLLMQGASIYSLVILIAPSIWNTIKKMRFNALPMILYKQLNTFMWFLVVPYFLTECIQLAYYLFLFFQPHIYITVSCSTILLLITFYYCIHQVLGLRFLNFDSHVKTTHSLSFIQDFTDLLEQLSKTTTILELSHLTHLFFKEAFAIPLQKITLYLYPSTQQKAAKTTIESLVEHHMLLQDKKTSAYIHHHKILLYDELAFSEFYEADPTKKNILSFLESINADIFLPIFQGTRIIAYIIIERHARYPKIYSKHEYDEMLIFAQYLGTSIHLINNTKLESVIKSERELTNTLYFKHQEIRLFKESIRSFLRSSKQKPIGIIFYRNRKFSYANKDAHTLLGIDINQHAGLHMSKSLRHIAHQVHDYKIAHTCLIEDTTGKKLVTEALPSLAHNSVVITIHYPDVTDILTEKITLLNDQNRWDYLLYLETTDLGKSIHQIIPGSSSHLLAFKIELLKAIIRKKPILLEMADPDLDTIVTLLHTHKLRDQLYTLTLTAEEQRFSTAVQIFGASPFFTLTDPHNGLLQLLHPNGTLFIKNIHHLSHETQRSLAKFLSNGTYQLFRSDQKMTSTVQIICSTHYGVTHALQDGMLVPELVDQLQTSHLCIPSLLTLPEDAFEELIDGYTNQITQEHLFKNLFTLTAKEKEKLLHNRPTSISQLKEKIERLLLKKSRKNTLIASSTPQEDQPTHPLLVHAARLGKKALRDKNTMTLLWNTFKNQNKIASFLAVNRSSINRRCKQYKLN